MEPHLHRNQAGIHRDKVWAGKMDVAAKKLETKRGEPQSSVCEVEKFGDL